MFLMSDVENQIISSKFVKEIASLGGNINNSLLDLLLKCLKIKFNEKITYLFILIFSLLTNNIFAQNNLMILKLSYGDVEIELYPEKALIM